MKRILNPKQLPLEVLLLGIIGLALRRGLYTYGVDARGLIVAGHPLQIALWVVAALTAAGIVSSVWKMEASEDYADNFAPSLAAAIGHILMACGILLTVLLNDPAMPGPIGQLWKGAGLLSAPLLLVAAFSRARGQVPSVLTHAAVCVFFAFHLVCHYQTWCSDPQLLNYLLAFLGVIGLMLFSYYQAAFDAGCGRRRMLLAVGLLTAWLCIVTLSGTEYLFLYLGGAVWTLTGLCRMQGVPRRKTEA